MEPDPRGLLRGIAYKPQPRADLIEVPRSTITTTDGLEGDCRGRSRRRQLTVLAVEDWQAACAELAVTLPWILRRANLLVSGVALPRIPGAQLQLGPVLLEVTGQTTPCWKMDALRPGLQAALWPQWRGGVTCRVLRAGAITVGDAARAISHPQLALGLP